MQTFEFKKLEIENDESWLKRTLKSAHFRKTAIYAIAGAVIGYVIFKLTDGYASGAFWTEDALKNVAMGFGLGIFLTNSPCARGRC